MQDELDGLVLGALERAEHPMAIRRPDGPSSLCPGSWSAAVAAGRHLVSQARRENREVCAAQRDAFGSAPAHLVSEIPRNTRVEPACQLLVEEHLGRLPERVESAGQQAGPLDEMHEVALVGIVEDHGLVRDSVSATQPLRSPGVQ